MIEDFPGNSRRAAQPSENNATPPAVEDKHLEAIVAGKVVRRKKTLGRRFMDTFFSGDTGVFSSVLKEVVVPAIQDLLTDMVKQGIERAVYGEVRSRGRTIRGSSSPLSRTHVSYDRPSSTTRSIHTAPPIGRRPVQQYSLDIDDIVLEDRIAVEVVMTKMYEILHEYNGVTLADLYILLGQSPEYTDHKWGWRDLDGLDAQRDRDGYRLILPPLVSLRP